MNKAVMISVQPKCCELIASGKKTIEVRKTAPKIGAPFKCYIYETKGLCETPTIIDEDGHCSYRGRGQVIGEFICDRIDEYIHKENNRYWWNFSSPEHIDEIKEKTCLTVEQIIDYAGDSDTLYGWHISDLKVYDTPKELGEFRGYCEKKKKCYNDVIRHCRSTHFDWKCNPLTRPPQSWFYVEEI